MFRLVMIVKNEHGVIERGLRASLPHVDSWCIVDTGSTDDTKEIITRVADELGVPGKLYEREWKNFGHNRTEALQLAREQNDVECKWLLMIDADDILNAPAGKKLRIPKKSNPGNRHNSFALRIVRGSILFFRNQIFLASAPWLYRGVLHEYPDLPEGTPRSCSAFPDKDVFLDARTEGARSLNPHKYRDDALLLEAEMERNPDDSRSVFYAAQSWRDSGNAQRSMELYLRRYSMTQGYNEERYVALLNVIRMSDDIPQALRLAWLSLDVNPKRRECVAAIFAKIRTTPPSTWTQEMVALGMYCLKVSSAEPSDEFLFAEPHCYAWIFADELSIIAYYTGHHQLTVEMCKVALQHCPKEHCERITVNMNKSKLLLDRQKK